MSEKKTILDWALHWEKEAPDMLHFVQPLGGSVDNVKTWTFAQALKEARRVAAYLERLDLPPKSRIAICSKNCAHWILADWAIWMAGHISVPLYPVLNAETVRYILEHSESKLLFVGKLDPVWAQMEPGVPGDVRRVGFPLAPPGNYERWDDILARHEPIARVAQRSLDEMATIVYTSGSTGQPKGVMLSFGAMAAPTEGLTRMFSFNPSDRMLSYLPLAHTMERWIIGGCSTRAPFQVFFAESVNTFLQDLQRARPTLFLSVPRLYAKFQAGVFKKLPPKKLDLLLSIPIVRGIIKKKVLRGLGLDKVRFAGSGSAPIAGELLAWYRKLGLELLEGYGMSENFNYSHVNKVGQVRVGFVGSPYEGVECKLSADKEVLVKSPGMMMGYYKQPNDTREAFTEDGFLKTGDCGVIDELGRLQITGRVKEIFKTSKGKYVAPAPIENRLMNHRAVEQVCVSGAGEPQPHALIVLSEEGRAVLEQTGKQALEGQLLEHLNAVNKELDSIEQLQFLSVVKDEWTAENGFLTPTLKIKRSKIEEAYKSQVPGWYARNSKVVWADAPAAG
jgi:long-subunit acyl-CoA synthetase (AMP-forming)